ncbi:MAG: phosphonate ABC transporter substrate-binding protein, partial [bacterium]|nr:phosphonate ABC transporter substrate-binding protein [bacterium]
VLRETNPELIAATRMVRASDWFGFPPIASPASASGSPAVTAIKAALLGMHQDARGREVLAQLRLDRFAVESPELFASIEANRNLVRSIR